MAHIGHYISGAGHVGLIGVMLFGPLSTADPLPFEVANVSVVTSEEFAALTARPSTVTPAPTPQPPATPEIAETDPAPAPTPDDAPPPADAPQAPQAAPAPEAIPEPPAPPAPVEPPQNDVTTLVTPPTPVVPDAPDISERPRLRPADRVAPEPVAPPEPDTVIDEETQEAIAPDASDDTTDVQEAQEATSPEAAAPEIVTEAEEGPPSAPAQSIRPQARPNRPAPQVAETPPPETDNSDAVAAALQEALSGETADTAPAPAPTGPPLTAGERAGLVVAVQDCWVVDVGSQAADVIVTVAMDMNRDGTVAGGVRLLSAEGGDTRAQEVAFQAARRAVLRCQRGGYDLPPEKYEQWKQIEITFNPESMRVR
ncbi:cell envelope biogenesis protein TolA [Primorskyibacter sp. S187A]|uniref:cell envelope biogenesis protein TolA n=1 Tax=Primorskyibacter sp. S187A TaxID=3415130 RepID=UPI003C7CC4ED